MSSDFVFVSAEASGDDLSVSVIRELKKNDPDISVSAIGGPALEDVGLSSPIDVAPLGVLGLFEGLKIYRTVIALADEATDFIIQQAPKAVILVDSWGFMLRVAQRLRTRAPEIKIIKLVGPQVWATRPGRAKTLAKTVDHLLCIHTMEVPFYEPYGLDCTVIGNPALDRMERVDGEPYRAAHNISSDDRLLLILPGSRKSEIDRVAPSLAQGAAKLKDRYGDILKVFVLVSPSIRAYLEEAEIDWPTGTVFETDSSKKPDLMAAADVALACSGTVTTELASQGCAMVIGYRMGFVTWLLANYFLYKPEYITLFNVAGEDEIAKELVQSELTPDALNTCAAALLEDPEKRTTQIDRQFTALRKMGLGGQTAAQIAADTIRRISA
ncbi:lipid-A-disaccharide synthase [Ponticaulis sp.]|uniref:lipid-A-disaccharide synthase n=1 Tax=Ponticaulis sp. TaxID=2020902 RepID=UPI000B64B3B8|nr:lipid-A-disaccharide synthase [Ponticaulis sp.]MAI89432.1 lipid-A-disaccharide synthase [Ponticaulis sp.]OUY00470.1 MAG: lipid-A-disaccharide synthase [Hyphomonadaceae bacterium TMED5]|tara:strand:- start:79634 stop:80785 length:1152 start_codon:yes stop_codon:yes gene_type:complete